MTQKENPEYNPFEHTTSIDGNSDYLASLTKYLDSKTSISSGNKKTIIVVGRHKYYPLFHTQLIECALNSKGEISTPMNPVNPLELVWKAENHKEIKFYTSLTKFQTFYEKSPGDIEALKALVNNPLQYEFYYHDTSISEKTTPRSVVPIQLRQPSVEIVVRVNLDNGTYQVSCDLFINHSYCSLNRSFIRFDHFIVVDNDWFLCTNQHLLKVMAYFKQYDNLLRLQETTFLGFQKEVLSKMETYVTVKYDYLKTATPSQIRKNGFEQPAKRIIYLSELNDYVILDPVMLYGEVEIPVLTKKQIYGQDRMGKPFLVERNYTAEDDFIGLLTRQHPYFAEQLEDPLQYFYLHKTRFLDESWFLDTFEDWTNNNIRILGFNDLKNNKLNPQKANISIHVSSGLNWFNADIKVKFGSKKASLKRVQQSVKNKSKYVTLDDGTIGILPEEWIVKLQEYFQAGQLADDEALHIPKFQYQSINKLFDVHMLDEEVKNEANWLQARLTNFESIKPVSPPEALKAALRPYQLQGLSWLNFLDDFNFGGCLADDMGLGKTLQIIAFILLLREKHAKGTHLLVAPTSLLHTWEEEIQKFAPSIKVHILHGADRSRNTAKFDNYELVITSYGTLVTDITFLKNYTFSYVFLDESQNIKNINSQRYKAARLLTSRNRIAISGTPIENHTFDLYAQFSFACPGLLGTPKYFRHTYVNTIEKFQHRASASALQRKIAPFLLRRTKKEVATELPEKTEMILHCEMGSEQRKIYDAYEREFRDYISSQNEEEIAKHPMNVLRGITRLRQICNSPLLIDEAMATTASKIEMLLEQLKNLSGEHKILVFSQFVTMLDLIKKELNKEGIKYTSLTGATRNRAEVVEQFQTDEETRVFLISLKAGGTGLNLTAADYVFIVDPWWNPAVENQAIDRMYRIGQKKNVIAVRLICPGTVEEKILQMHQNKAKLVNELVRPDSNFFKSLTKEDLLGLTEH